jgi:cytochrome b561
MYWIVSVLALAALGLGWSLDYLAEGSQSFEIASLLHITLGIGLAALVVIVPIWRLFAPTPSFPTARPHWLQISLRVSESLLFILLAVSAATGYLGWAFSGGATPGWADWLPASISFGRHAGSLFSRWHEIAAIVVTAPILATLGLLAWGALKGHRMPHLIPHHRPPPVVPEALRLLKAAQARRTPAESEAPPTPPDQDLVAKGRALARQLKIFGAIGFWAQLCLGLVAALLLVVTTSSSYYEEHLPALPYGFSWADGIVWAYVALGVLALTIIGFYACVLLARPLKHGEFPVGGAASVRRLISTVNFGNALGLTLAIVGTAFSIALLISKTVSQPPGIAITDPQLIVRAVDVFVLLANFNIVVAHFLGILICLWFLNRVHHLGCGPEGTAR